MEKFNFESSESNKIDPYFEWQKRMAKSGDYNVGELKFIEYAIADGNDLDLDKALGFVLSHYEDRGDLLADIYIKMGNKVDAMNSILKVNRSDNYALMTETLDNFIDKFPEEKDSIIDTIKKNNPDFYKSIPREILE